MQGCQLLRFRRRNYDFFHSTTLYATLVKNYDFSPLALRSVRMSKVLRNREAIFVFFFIAVTEKVYSTSRSTSRFSVTHVCI